MPAAITLNFERVFDASFERVSTGNREGRTFIQSFYDRFIAASPEVREKFRATDMKRQIAMLEKSLHYIAYLFNTESFYSAVEKTAVLHNRANKDIPPEMYDLWLEKLIETVRDFDPAFDPQVELSWRLSLARGLAYMKFMHAR